MRSSLLALFFAVNSAAALVLSRPHLALNRVATTRCKPPCCALELSKPPFVSADVIDTNTGQPLRIDPRNDAWLPITVKSDKRETLPDGALRFVAEGRGKVLVGNNEYVVGPDTLVTVVADSELVWTCEEGCKELELLAPDCAGEASIPKTRRSPRTRSRPCAHGSVSLPCASPKRHTRAQIGCPSASWPVLQRPSSSPQWPYSRWVTSPMKP